jgi:hypothetical protein
MHDATPHITRADLAGALVDLARAERNVAMVLAVCEAWEPGYVASLLARAETLAARDHRAGPVEPSVHERSLSAIDRCIRHDNPFQRVHQSGVLASTQTVDALIDLLDRQAKFHDIAGELERRLSPRT